MLTYQELATVLAALRYWQQGVEADPDGYPLWAAEHFEGTEPLSAEQIERLCERLNSQGESADDDVPTMLQLWDGQEHDSDHGPFSLTKARRLAERMVGDFTVRLIVTDGRDYSEVYPQGGGEPRRGRLAETTLVRVPR